MGDMYFLSFSIFVEFFFLQDNRSFGLFYFVLGLSFEPWLASMTLDIALMNIKQPSLN